MSSTVQHILAREGGLGAMPRVHINGVNLHHEVSGAGSSVVLCHGYSGSHQDWMFQIPAFSQTHEVVSMDHRGHGSSDAPSLADAYSIPIFAEDVHLLLNYIGITKCCLIHPNIFIKIWPVKNFILIHLLIDFE